MKELIRNFKNALKEYYNNYGRYPDYVCVNTQYDIDRIAMVRFITKYGIIINRNSLVPLGQVWMK